MYWHVPTDPRRPLLVALLLALMLPAGAHAQATGLGDEPLPRPLEVLLQQKEALGLTSDQLGRLDRIQQDLATQNEPLVTRMMALRTQWQQERRTARGGSPPNVTRVERIRADAEELRQRIQNNNRTAMQTVNRMLTQVQRKQLRQIVQQRRDEKPGKRAGGGSNADGRR